MIIFVASWTPLGTVCQRSAGAATGGSNVLFRLRRCGLFLLDGEPPPVCSLAILLVSPDGALDAVTGSLSQDDLPGDLGAPSFETSLEEMAAGSSMAHPMRYASLRRMFWIVTPAVGMRDRGPSAVSTVAW